MKQMLCMLLVGCSYFSDGTVAHTQAPDAAQLPPVDAGERFGHRLFVTSAVYQGGALGGPFGADAICQKHADLAALGGKWRAWLSGVGASPNNTMARDDANYFLVTGYGIDDIVAHGWQDLVDGSIYNPINVTEFGAHHQSAPSNCMSSVVAWTNTGGDGNPIDVPNQDYSCGGWALLSGQGAVGFVERTGIDWTHGGCSLACNEFAALYCVEQ